MKRKLPFELMVEHRLTRLEVLIILALGLNGSKLLLDLGYWLRWW